jgi:hypothetical protein
MNSIRTLGCAAAAGLCLAIPAQPASAQLTARPQPQLVSRRTVTSAVELSGVVADQNGHPLAGAVVSAIGSDSAFAVSDRDGRFTFRTLPQGPYVVRAHLQGYLPARARLIQVGTSAHSAFTITLVKRSESVDAPTVLAAGVGVVDEPQAAGPEPADTHEHDELAWRLRHLKRSVLKDDGHGLPGLGGASGDDRSEDGPGAASGAGLRRAVGGSARVASSLLADLPLAGQFNFLTTTSFERPQDLFSSDAALPRGVAFLSLAAPMANGEWQVRGALTQGDLSSWIVAGSYAHELRAPHAYQAGFSYGMQRYAGGNAAALASMRDGSRTVGALYAYDQWTVTPAVRLDYGAKYANYGYLRDRDQGLWSPRAGIEIRPSQRDSLLLRASASYRESAPGAEEFIPPALGVWLPPERTFSPVSRHGTFSAQKVEHVEVSAERQLPGELVVGVRAFRERGDDQIVTLFGLSVLDDASIGHYRVGSAGDFDARGWGVNVSRQVGEGTRATIDYSLVDADWTRPSPDARVLAFVASQVLRTSDRVHDLTASVESVLAPTSTRVFVLYKLNTAVASPGFEQANAGGARFDVQVNQALPFLGFTNARWEALVAVKNVFHDDFANSSVYDELLVIRPPTRVLGGVTVKF